MAVQVSGGGTTSSQDRCRFPLRFGTGIPIVSFSANSTANLILVKGDGVSPSSFSTIFSVTAVPYETAHNTWVMISSTLAMCGQHISSGMTVELRQWTVNEAGTNNGGALIVALDEQPSFSNLVFDTAVDSNGALHVIYTDNTTSMGTAYLTLYYINNVGGSWNSRVAIYGAPSTVNFDKNNYPTIIIDGSNFPVIGHNLTAATYRWSRGNANNSTSFTTHTVGTGVWSYNTLGVDIRGDHYVFGQSSGNLAIQKHESGDAWTTNAYTTITNKVFSTLYGVRIQGNYAYVVFKDQTNNASGVSIAKIDISGTTPTYVSTDELATDDWFEWEATFKNSPLYHNYDSSGTDNGVADNGQNIDLALQLYDGVSAYDPYWDTYATAVVSNVSKIKVSSWKDFAAAPQINIGGTWKTVTAVKINIGGVWKDVDITP